MKPEGTKGKEKGQLEEAAQVMALSEEELRDARLKMDLRRAEFQRRQRLYNHKKTLGSV
jgi:hypothetical protein